MGTPRTSVPPVEVSEGKDKVVKTVLDKLTEQELADADLGTIFISDDGVEKVLIAKDWLDEVEERLISAERSTVTRVKDAVLSHKRKLVLGVTTVVALSAAAYAVTHKDEVLEAIEHTTEVTAEKAELSAQDVKKTARKARTGSTTK